ncbi:MAG: methionyl-tRNA formyltransferase [Prevotellaceae bacterium]|nr:methionyl-tRNA formyltransferase [Prevotellaceae bacterium]
MRIIYMGTPDFSVQPLETLLDNGCEIVAVVTMPDKPAGRGHKIQFSPVKQFALKKNLKILQPEKLKDEFFLAELLALNADLQVVVAFRMLPEVVWNMPPLGTINLHASLLPQYRGAAPINWAVINGEKQTGVTTFLLRHEIDTGNILFQQSIDIQPTDNAGTIHDKLMQIGSELVLKTVKAIEKGEIQPIPQQILETQKPAPKIFKDDCRLDFSKSAAELHNFVRGLSPYPAAFFEFLKNGEPTTIKVFETLPEIYEHNFELGKILTDGKKELKITVSDGFLHIKTLQISGKKQMSAEDFLRGNSLEHR